MNKSPTTHQVAQVIVEEMMKWDLKDTVEERQGKLYDTADRLIRYFQFFDVLPTTLPGLPGGKSLG